MRGCYLLGVIMRRIPRETQSGAPMKFAPDNPLALHHRKSPTSMSFRLGHEFGQRPLVVIIQWKERFGERDSFDCMVTAWKAAFGSRGFWRNRRRICLWRL